MAYYYKVAVWDWKAKNYKGAWVIKHVGLKNRAKAQDLVEGYARDGVIARWSRYDAKTYHYAM